jgi:CheY-like chemotaxis protein
MRTAGPLVLVEDDSDDQELMVATMKELGMQKEIRIFRNGQEALDFLNQSTERPFLILSDINMPVMDGITFKKHIDGCPVLKKKCIPFVFISTSPAPFVNLICELNIQGCFEKGSSMRQLSETLRTILTYWDLTKHLIGV